ncbi:sigma-70 family RNA polymerase sigma factor [candidate division WOR-3 bacterium]|nr:sigma-70 family RNA polymerase sigma factor [candidate division WOR-3 bacterium]
MLRWVSDRSLSRYFKEIMRYPLISREKEEGLARRARLGDVIIAVDDRGCNSPRTLLSRIKRSGPDSRLKITVHRGEKDIDLTLEIPASFSPQEAKKEPDAPILGMRVCRVQELDAPRIKVLGIKRGLLVTELEPDSSAALADLCDYNREARDRLILHNLRWVVTIAKQYQNRGLALAELINEGNLGLIQAVTKFDERRKTRLTTYSNWWIRYYIVSALASRHLIKLPIKMRNLAKRIRDSYGVLSQRLGRSPSIEELARELKATPEDVSAAFDCGVAELSIDAMPFEDSKVTFEEVLRDTTSPSPAEVSAKDEMERHVRSSLAAVLADRELYVVSRHFGVPMPQERRFTIKKLTAIFGKTEEEIQQIVCQASRKILSRLRLSLSADELKHYAKLTAADMRRLPQLLRKRRDYSKIKSAMFKIMRRVAKNIPSLVSDHLEVEVMELEELRKKKLADLQKIAESFSIDTMGMEKEDLVKAILKRALQEQEIFCLCWNVPSTREELNLRELGDLLGVSREAARQVKERAIRKLKKHLRPQAFDSFFRKAV